MLSREVFVCSLQWEHILGIWSTVGENKFSLVSLHLEVGIRTKGVGNTFRFSIVIFILFSFIFHSSHAWFRVSSLNLSLYVGCSENLVYLATNVFFDSDSFILNWHLLAHKIDEHFISVLPFYWTTIFSWYFFSKHFLTQSQVLIAFHFFQSVP